MSSNSSQLLAILAIGHDTSMRGEGISLREAKRRTDYIRLRKQFDSKDLLPLIRANPHFIEQWLAYSEDKRTGGWWLRLDPPSIGRTAGKSFEFKTVEEAVAEYVVREMDYWSAVG